MKYFFSFILITYSLCCPLTIYAEDTRPNPHILINEMSKATDELNYDGIFVYRHGAQIDTMRIIHKKTRDGDIYERLISLTGNPREIIRDKDKVKYYFPENKLVIVEKKKLGQFISAYIPNQIKSISDSYNFNIIGEGRVAGLDAWIVNIKPIDKHRYGYQLWIDKDTKLLLKSKLKNYQGVTLEHIMFAQINVLDNINDSLLEPTFSGSNFTWIDNMKSNYQRKSNKKWVASWIPKGFLMRERLNDRMPASNTPVEHLIYTDGLAIISIFVEKINNKQKEMSSETTTFGGTNTYSTLNNGYQITAVGEVPINTIKLIADSVKQSH